MQPTIRWIRIRDSFPAAHRIRIDEFGTREPIHVHHWRVTALFEASGEHAEVAAQQARTLISSWVRRHRGRCFNDIEPFDRINPTAEEVARQLAHLLAERAPELPLIELKIGEAAGFSATYRIIQPT